MNNWAYQWKMSFDPDPSKQAQKAIFLVKLINQAIQSYNQVIETPYQKHLDMVFIIN